LVGNILGGWELRLFSNIGADLIWGPIRDKIRNILINLQKSSSHEPLARMLWYLACFNFGERRLKFVHI